MALGGSTNAVLHLIAMARAFDIDLTIDDFQTVSDHQYSTAVQLFVVSCFGVIFLFSVVCVDDAVVAARRGRHTGDVRMFVFSWLI